MRAIWPLIAAVLAVLAVGCDKTPEATDSKPQPAASAPSAAPALASASAAAHASASAAPAQPSAANRFKGTYKAKVGAVTPPKEAEVKIWAKDPGTAQVGDGTLSLEASGSGKVLRVVGEGAGALGDLVISGELEGTELTARIDAKDPNADTAMTGFLTGKLEGTTIKATMRVSSRNANVAREAEVTLTRE